VRARPLRDRLLLLAVLLLVSCSGFGAGVTLVTHGFNGNVTDWVIPMCNRIPQYQTFPGTNYSIYQISITRSGSVYSLSQTFLGGSTNPLASDSGEIIIALDWSTLATLSPAVSSTNIAAQAVNALLSTNLIAAMAGKPLAELPLHLAGHSRGASVVTEMARLLGAQGIWVDHVTTWDPFPVSFILGDPAPPVKIYANVFFADDYWQNTDSPSGQAVSGAYSRYLTNVTGGYPSGSAHSDTHLWYHGTIDLSTPATDTQATITSTERTNWWTVGEAGGKNTGFCFSLIGQGDRLSTNQPEGPGTGQVRDGLNKTWDFGAGVSANRSSLPADNGAWPNIIRFGVTGTNQFLSGDSIPVHIYCQYGSNAASTATASFFLDRDSNPHDGNETQIGSATFASTGTNQVLNTNLNLFSTSAVPPGTYALFAKVADSFHTRYLYASQKVIISANSQPPSLTNVRLQGGQFQLTINGIPGQTIILQASTNLLQWIPLQTNLLSTTSVTNFDSTTLPNRYYRAALVR
jgi:hypothetical protein